MPQTATLALNALLIFTLCIAVVTDLRSRRISNRLTYSAMGVGLAIHVVAGGWGGLSSGALGWLVGFAILLLPCLLGGIGAGDVKLMAAIGALQGPGFVVYTAIYAGLAGGVLAVCYLAGTRGLGRPLWAVSAASAPTLSGDIATPRAVPAAGTLPYGLAIAAGAIIALLRGSAGVF